MAEKTMKTRIKLKYDTLSNWTTADPVLLQGEVAVVNPGTTIDGHTTILLKVGDGTKKFSELDYVWSKAADVYDWAKSPTKPTYTFDEIEDTPAIGDGTVSIFKDGTKQGEFTLNQDDNTVIELTDDDTQYQLVLTGHVLKLQSKAKGATSWSDVSGQSFTLPDNNTTYLFESAGVTSGAYFNVTSSDAIAQTVYIAGLGSAAFKETESFATATQGQKADTAVQNVELATGTNNGTLKLTVDGTATDNIAVKGLGSAAFTDSSAYATAEQGTKADNAMPKSGGTFTGTVILNGNPTQNLGAATKQYVDSAIAGVSQFSYQVVESLPTASKDTMGTIYLVKHEHSTQDSYDEYITIESGTTTKTYSWEKIGNTDIDLSGYVPTSRTINGLPLTGDITLTATNVLTDSELNAIHEVDNIKTDLDKKQDKNINISGITADTVEGALSEIKAIADSKQTAQQVNTAITTELAKHAGIDKVGTITAIRMNSNIVGTSGEVNLGTVVTDITGDTYISATKDTSTSASMGKITLGLSEKVVTTDDTLILDCGSATENI